MTETSGEIRHIRWAECFGFTQIFRSFRMAIGFGTLSLAFCGVLGTYVAGRMLDGLWASSSQPLVLRAGDRSLTELDLFAHPSEGGRKAASDWVEANRESGEARRVGVFALLLGHTRSTMNGATVAAVRFDCPGMMAAVRQAGLGVAWLVGMHPLFAILFGLTALFIWAYFGGALCRVAALKATREEDLGLWDALAFSRRMILHFFAAPLMPLGVMILLAIPLALGGLIGAIPVVGELVTGLLFFLALILGFALAFVAVGGVAGFSLTFPTVAVEGSDAFDALSRSFSYIYQRPWKTVFYGAVASVYGAVCLVFVKLFMRVLLWAVHLCVGETMNWGSARLAGSSAQAVGKLDAIWSSPLLLGDSPFWGGFDTPELAGASWLGQILMKVWIYLILGLVVSYVVSFYYSASTVIYLLLRREVDATDLEDLWIEESEVGGAPDESSESPEEGKSGDTSLPVIGQGSE